MLDSVKFFGRIITPSISNEGRLSAEIVQVQDNPVKLNIGGENIIGTDTWVSHDVSQFVISSDTINLVFTIQLDEDTRKKKLIAEVSIKV